MLFHELLSQLYVIHAMTGCEWFSSSAIGDAISDTFDRVFKVAGLVHLITDKPELQQYAEDADFDI